MGEPMEHEGPHLQLDELAARLVGQARDVLSAQNRIQGLLQANHAIVADLGLASVLERIVEAACRLVDAPYGALGVIDPSGVGVQEFIHVGMDEETVRAIGHLPQGKGLLGALIDAPRPIRLRTIADDPRSVGFPSGHPELKGFLGVPVRVRDEVYGNLYLASPTEGNFTPEDEELVAALAATAGVAIDNAKLFEESVQRQEWLEATTDTTRRVLTLPGDEALRIIGHRVAELAEADVVAVALPPEDDPGSLRVIAAVGLDADRMVGFVYPRKGSLSGAVIATGEPQAFDDARYVSRPHVMVSRLVPLGPVMIVPLAGARSTQGVLVVGRAPGQPPFSDANLAMATNFAHHASVALELAEARREAQRLMLIEERSRIARDLHDHVIQHLFGAGMALQGVVARTEASELAEALTRVVDQIDDAIRQIRTYVFQLRMPAESAASSAPTAAAACATWRSAPRRGRGRTPWGRGQRAAAPAPRGRCRCPDGGRTPTGADPTTPS